MIKGYENIYLVSNFGQIKNIKTNQILKPIDSHGYKYVHLCDENHKRTNKPIHRLVAFHFLQNYKNFPQVNHKDGNKSNNHVDNLEWCSHKDNMVHSSEKLHRHCKKVKCVETGQVFESIKDAAKYYHKSRTTLSAVLRGHKYYKTFATYHWQYML